MSDAGKTTVLLADDHTLVRQGLRSLFVGHPDIEIVAEARDGAASRRSKHIGDRSAGSSA